MLSFENDYSEGCHPRILEALTRTNLEQLPGYGADHYCAEAAEKIRVACQAPQAQVFFITGGTKVGALCGEALVFCQQPPARIVARIKQHGALNAKGRLLGIQFDVLFTDGLYFQLGRRAVERAMEMKRRFLAKGYRLWLDSPTNQQFLLLEDAEAERLAKLVRYSRWEKPDDSHTVVRFATSWATTPEMLDELDRLLVAQN